MSSLIIPFIDDLILPGEEERLHSLMQGMEKHVLQFAPWDKGRYPPDVQFSIAHNGESILLIYFVTEKYLRAAVTEKNGPVWEDSCVEFFMEMDGRGYYNFEFNCLGNFHAAFGKDRKNRELLPDKEMDKIFCGTKIKKRQDLYQWELALMIPKSIFSYHSVSTLKGLSGRANFYKCGDALPDPHYLSWSDIESPEPDFHLPHFFGDIRFV